MKSEGASSHFPQNSRFPKSWEKMKDPKKSAKKSPAIFATNFKKSKRKTSKPHHHLFFFQKSVHNKKSILLFKFDYIRGFSQVFQIFDLLPISCQQHLVHLWVCLRYILFPLRGIEASEVEGRGWCIYEGTLRIPFGKIGEP